MPRARRGGGLLEAESRVDGRGSCRSAGEVMVIPRLPDTKD